MHDEFAPDFASDEFLMGKVPEEDGDVGGEEEEVEDEEEEADLVDDEEA